MLIGIHTALTPDLLRHLRAMGHGDEIVIADANFPGALLKNHDGLFDIPRRGSMLPMLEPGDRVYIAPTNAAVA